MKLLLLSFYFAPDTASTGMYMAQLCEGLRKHGHQINVVTSFPHYKHRTIWQEYQGKFIEKDQTINKLVVLRSWVFPAPSDATFFQRALNYLSYNVLSTFIGTCISGRDVILATSPPLTVGFTAYLISRIKRIPFIYAIQDIWPEVVVEVGQLQGRFTIAFFKWMERFIYKKAGHLIVLSEGMRRNLLAKGVPDEKISIIPSIVDTDFIRPLPKSNPFSQNMELEKRFVVLHAGNLGHSQGLETLLESAKLLLNEKRIVFLIVGEGVAKDGLQRQKKRMNLENVRFIPYQPWEEVPNFLASSDIQVALLKSGLTAHSTPSKVYSAMASAKPIVISMDESSDTWNLVQETGAGVCFPPDNPQKLAKAILTLYRNPIRREEIGQKGRKYAVNNLSPQVVAEKYHQLIQSVVNQR